MNKAYYLNGAFVDSLYINQLIIKDGYLKINNLENIKVYGFTNKIIIPGLVDLHFHVSQYNYIDTAMDLTISYGIPSVLITFL